MLSLHKRKAASTLSADKLLSSRGSSFSLKGLDDRLAIFMATSTNAELRRMDLVFFFLLSLALVRDDRLRAVAMRFFVAVLYRVSYWDGCEKHFLMKQYILHLFRQHVRNPVIIL